MRIYNICDSLSISVVKHVQLQKMLNADTITCYNACGMVKFASERCGVMIKPPNVQSLEHFCKWADVVVVHTSTRSTNLLGVNTYGSPIIWACHDLVADYKEFKHKIKACIVPSVGYKDRLVGEDFPTLVIHRKLASADWPQWRERRINCTIMPGIVSEDERTPYRNYSKALSELNGLLMVQSAQLPSMMAEKYPIMETVGPETMLKRVAMFETSWCGCGTDDINFDCIVNNKMHESIACGCVPILYRSREMSEYVDQYECGITWSGRYPTQDRLYRCRQSIRQNKAVHCLEFEKPILQALLSSL